MMVMGVWLMIEFDWSVCDTPRTVCWRRKRIGTSGQRRVWLWWTTTVCRAISRMGMMMMTGEVVACLGALRLVVWAIVHALLSRW